MATFFQCQCASVDAECLDSVPRTKRSWVHDRISGPSHSRFEIPASMVAALASMVEACRRKRLSYMAMASHRNASLSQMDHLKQEFSTELHPNR